MECHPRRTVADTARQTAPATKPVSATPEEGTNNGNLKHDPATSEEGTSNHNHKRNLLWC